MVNVFKIKKGLDINLKGKAERIKVRTGASDEFVLSPASFEGVVPKVVVREGENVMTVRHCLSISNIPTWALHLPSREW